MSNKLRITALVVIIVASCCSVGVHARKKDSKKDQCTACVIAPHDVAAMQRLYCANDPEGGRDIRFTQCAPVFTADGVQAIWLTAGDDSLTGAIFLRKDGKLNLVAETGPNRKPSLAKVGDKDYLSVSGSAGGPSWYREIYVYSGGQLVETFSCLEVYANIDACALNGQEITPEQAQAYIDALPQF